MTNSGEESEKSDITAADHGWKRSPAGGPAAPAGVGQTSRTRSDGWEPPATLVGSALSFHATATPSGTAIWPLAAERWAQIVVGLDARTGLLARLKSVGIPL